MAVLTLDKSKYKAYRKQQVLDLDHCEFDILWVLSSRPDRVFSVEDIAVELQKEYIDLKNFSIPACLKNLQKKLGCHNIRLIGRNGFQLEFKP